MIRLSLIKAALMSAATQWMAAALIERLLKTGGELLLRTGFRRIMLHLFKPEG
jgi:hypothetical protein